MHKQESVWDSIRVNHRKRLCSFCGQPVEGMAFICDMCEQHMYAGVLSICRSLLIKSKRDVNTFSPRKTAEEKQKMPDDPSVQEVAVSRVLNQFPKELAKRTKQFRKSLNTEGVWFSHLCAWWMVRSIREVDAAPEETIGDPIYKEMRDLVFTYLSKGERGLEEGQLETIMNIYSLDGSDGSARRVIAHMITLLEEEGKIKIDRPAEEGMSSDDDRLASRRAISKMMFSTGKSSSPSPSPGRSSSGMHTRED